MTHEEKTKLFKAKNQRQLFRGAVTPPEKIPIQFTRGPSNPPPGGKSFIATSDVVLWVQFTDDAWFRPYGSFDEEQILAMLDECRSDAQIISLIEMLSAKR